VSETEVRPEAPEDREAVARVVEAAFGRRDEAELVEALRADPAWELSLVAEEGGEVVGHVLFTRASEGFLALAPLAVQPERQGAGVGRALVEEGLRRLEGRPVLVLGDPAYYGRFGFEPAAPRGITNPWRIDGPEWMVRGDAEPAEVRYPAPFVT
jgi:putative acetyltransferase